MSRLTRVSTKKSSFIPTQGKFSPPPVLQPKAEKQPDAKLPEWKPGGGGATNPVQRLLDRYAVQAKLTIGQPNDKYEPEADRVASQVMSTQTPTSEMKTALAPDLENPIQRQCADCAKEEQEQKGEEKKDLEEIGIQTKLTIGAPGDAYEQEADRVASQVMSMSAPADSSASVQRQLVSNHPQQIRQEAQSITPVVQTQIDSTVQMRRMLQWADKMDGNQASGNLESRLNASKGGGSLLSKDVRGFMEPRFGADFSSVRVHTGGEAVQMNRELRVIILSGTLNQSPDMRGSSMGNSEPTAKRDGGRAGINEIKWGKPLEEVEELRHNLLQQVDINQVKNALREFGIPADNQMIEAVKRYNFDSSGITFTPENYYAWRRLSTGNGTVNDARYLIHEMAEVKELQRIQQQTGFDFMGGNLDNMSRKQRRQWGAGFDRHYMAAHSKALEVEYDFISQQVAAATNNRVNISRTVAAAVDPTRDEARLYMLVNGIPLSEHQNFQTWQQRATEIVEIGTRAKEKLGLYKNPTLADLIEAVKRQKSR